MTELLPPYIPLLFIATTFATLLLFCAAVRRSDLASTRRRASGVLLGLAGWLTLQAVLALWGVYRSGNDTFPPLLLVFGILPAILCIIRLFATPPGRQFIDSLPVADLTYLHVVRIPVEMGLLLLAHHKAVPLLMTFEGSNFDIGAGITAPLVAYYGITKQQLGRRLLLGWNIVCLVLLFNIVVTALLAAPTPLQQLAFDQPNVAIFYFPYQWLPVFIVPVVLFCHLVAIRQLLQNTNV